MSALQTCAELVLLKRFLKQWTEDKTKQCSANPCAHNQSYQLNNLHPDSMAALTLL